MSELTARLSHNSKKAFTYSRSDVMKAILPILEADFKTAVVFIGKQSSLPVGKVKATRLYKRAPELRLTVGRLNFEERHWAKHQLDVFGKVPKTRLK